MVFKIREKNNGIYVSFDTDNQAYQFDIHPLDMGRSKPPEKLARATSKCLKSELEQRSSGSVNPRYLLGSCHKNARNLFEHLCGHGYNPKMVIGCNTSAGKPAGVRESFKRIKNIHQWVEVNSYTVEICSEANRSTGELYISQNKPSNYDEYIRMSKGRVHSLPVQYVESGNIDSVIQSLEN